jgi:hypothetical protein
MLVICLGVSRYSLLLDNVWGTEPQRPFFRAESNGRHLGTKYEVSIRYRIRGNFVVSEYISEGVNCCLWSYCFANPFFLSAGPESGSGIYIYNGPDPRIRILHPTSKCLSANISFKFTTVLPVPEKHSRPHWPKTTAIFEAFTATCQKFAAAWYFKAQQ